MRNLTLRLFARQASLPVLAASICLALIFVSGPGAQAQPGAGKNAPSASERAGASPNVSCPSAQCFTDVEPASTFFAFINNLYLDGIITGYPCGSSAEPCDPGHRPYYRPASNVTRGQMSKFVDLGRRNIADAVGLSLNLSNDLRVSGATTFTGPASINGPTIISSTNIALSVTGDTLLGRDVTMGRDVTIGHSLVISSSANITMHALTTSGGEAIIGECLQASNGCYGVAGIAPSGDTGGHFQGGEGIYAQSSDPGKPGAYMISYGSAASGAEIRGQNYRGAYVNSVAVGNYSLYVDRSNTGTTDLYVNSGAEIAGNLIVDGSKTGYVVDIMQNADDTLLVPGDVVVIVGSSAPVIGDIPVVTVRKTTTHYDTGVAGVVDQMMYVPDPATRAAYLAQQQAIRDARDAQTRAIAAAQAQGTTPDLSNIAIPEATINDDTGNLHALPDATEAAPGTYLNVVTLGSYKAVKVDAGFGPIHAGDLLTTSHHAGYAMKADDAKIKFGSVIGKALADLDTGTGTIPVMVTLK